MGLYNKDFSCPKCGRKDKGLEEGALMWSNDETFIYVCTKCKHLFSDLIKYTYMGMGGVNHGFEASSDPICPICGGEVEKWDYNCPNCGTEMIFKCNYIDD